MDWLTLYIHQALVASGIDVSAVFFGNTIGAYSIAGIVFCLALVIIGLAQTLLLAGIASIATRTQNTLDDALVTMVRSFRPPFFVFLSFWIATQYLVLEGFADLFVSGILLVWLTYQGIVVGSILIEDVIFHHVTKDRDETTTSALRLLTNIAKTIIWVFGILFALSNFGVNVTSLMAGAGIAGVAIAFAMQGILGDLFSSFSLYFDKPFKVGDFIIVGTDLGTVKHIGIKSTRILALSGEMLTISNQELTNARIQNVTMMTERRVVLMLGILIETPLEEVQLVPVWAKEAVEQVEGVRFDRAHLFRFGNSSLDFEVVYYVEGSDYTRYMDAQQAIHISLLKRLREGGVGLAYPTQTLYLTKES